VWNGKSVTVTALCTGAQQFAAVCVYYELQAGQKEEQNRHGLL